MHRWHAFLVVALLACDRPLAVTPTVATTTKGMRVCWRDVDEGDVGYSREIRPSLAVRLRDAGYVLVRSGCQLEVSWGYQTTTRYEETSFRTVTLVIRDGVGTSVETKRFEFTQSEMPVTDSSRLAALMVNTLNASPKVAALAQRTYKAPPSEPVIVSTDGITVTDATRPPVIQNLEATFASKPVTDRIDVNVTRGAPWSSVIAVFDALAAASRRAIRLRYDDVTAEVDLATDAQRAAPGTMMQVYIYNRDIDVTWRTDKSCADVPRTLHRTWNDAIAQSLDTCKAKGCFDRVAVGGRERGAELFIRTIALARKASASPVVLDTSVKERVDPSCRADTEIPRVEVSAIIANHEPSLSRCAEYVGQASVTMHVDTTGHVTTSAITFDEQTQMVWDREKTCILHALGALAFPQPSREVIVQTTLGFDSHHHVMPRQ